MVRQCPALLQLTQLQHLAYAHERLAWHGHFAISQLSALQLLTHLELGAKAGDYQQADLVQLAQRLPRLRHLLLDEAPPHAELSSSCPKLCVRQSLDAEPDDEDDDDEWEEGEGEESDEDYSEEGSYEGQWVEGAGEEGQQDEDW